LKNKVEDLLDNKTAVYDDDNKFVVKG